MKKFVALLLLVLMLTCSFAISEGVGIDLSTFTFEELIALRQKIDLLIFASDEYKEVTVPAGDYEVGLDIPAGTYTLDSKSITAMITVYSDSSKNFSELDACHSLANGEIVGKIELVEGQAVEIEFGSIIFKTYAGLGF